MHSNNKFSTILFDLDGTLRHSRPSFTDTFLSQAFQLGAPDSPEQRRQATRWLHYYWAQSPEMLADRQAYGTEEVFWTNHARLFLINLGCQPEQAQTLAPDLFRYYEEEFEPEDWVPPDVPDTLQALISFGYHLGVVSNRSQTYQQQLADLRLDQYFKCVVAAGEVNSWKPDTIIFQHALSELGVLPEDTIYVGDNYYADVVGSRRAGIQPILLDPQGIFPDADCPVIHTISDLIGNFLEQ